jgi:hypothetical protein
MRVLKGGELNGTLTGIIVKFNHSPMSRILDMITSLLSVKTLAFQGDLRYKNYVSE